MNDIVAGYVWLLWDILAVVLFAIFAFMSAERGFIRTIISFGGYLLAVVLADMFSPLLAEALYDGVVKDVIRLVILNRLGDVAGEATADVASAIPDGLARLMGDGATASFGDSLGELLGAEASSIVEELIDAALREPVLAILTSLCFLLVFTVAVLLVRYLSRIFRGMYKVPILGTADTILGGVAGILEGAIALIVISLVLRVLVGLSGGWVWLNIDVMEDTYVWRIFWNATNIVVRN